MLRAVRKLLARAKRNKIGESPGLKGLTGLMADRRRTVDDKQVRFTWTDPEEIVRNAEERGGAVLFEAPDTSRIIATKPPRLPRVRTKGASAREPDSLGLPFGTRERDGQIMCWSCGQEIGEADVVRSGPGAAGCPGCGARLPFA